jgi:sulfate transport system ATP-binding protein
VSIGLEHLTRRYDGHPVVNDVSLEVPEGELFVLLGPSGSGKSTILRMIAGLVPSDGGRVLLHGHDATALSPQERGIGFVFQQYALFQHMTVAENIEFGLRVRRVPVVERRKRRDELLELVGLTGLGARLPRQLSGGQQQRVALARALAPRPSVLLLDEPFGALDARIRVDLRRSLGAIQRDLGITTIFVTHDQEEAFELGDRLGVMNAGRLLEVGPASELYLRPQTEFVATFLGSANLLVGETTSDGIQLGPVRFPLNTRSLPQESRRVQVLFRPEDIALSGVREAGPGVSLGPAEVVSHTFSGNFERLRLRHPALAGVRPIAPPVPFGSDYFYLDVTRTQEQARRFRLQPGDPTWVQVQRIHALVHPGMSMLLASDGSVAGQAMLSLGARIARLAHARVGVLGADLDATPARPEVADIKQTLAGLTILRSGAIAGPFGDAVREEAERQPYDLIALGMPAQADLGPLEQALSYGDHHVLLFAEAASQPPAHLLISVAANETSKADVFFAGRLAARLGADATLLSVAGEAGDAPAGDGDDAGQGERLERFQQAAARTLALLGVPSRAIVRSGEPSAAIAAELRGSQYDLLVLGMPLRRLGSARMRPFLTGAAGCPVLLVRSPAAPRPVPVGRPGERIPVEEVVS